MQADVVNDVHSQGGLNNFVGHQFVRSCKLIVIDC